MKTVLASCLLAFLMVGLPAQHAQSATGDPKRGEAIYHRCLACHSLEHNRVGPRHCGLFGRKAGTVEGYAYSTAMKKYGVIWNEKTLDHFLENPLKAVPGTKMGYAGVKDPQERADLIAYLEQATRDPKICK
ncbi:cytochrome c family protein [Enhydrobacter sp.]|jgi:cytochrome c|uniref:c-type cytochrome n=1 Tax=Enhydrobacter sp. TaxID=1894999 RepID=UPI002629465F|nr:cytochrome c family protein [Enhydrobacter sp.]WIM10639.1 MAG: Cytochrome c2 [Enhydrobacter sp.]